MDLEARDIHEKEFHDAWRGYSQVEVDDFLDRVAEALDRVQRENRSLQSRVKELEDKVAQGREAEEVLKKTLVTAQRAAEEAIDTARSKAEKLIAEAESRSRKQADEASRRDREAERDFQAKRRELDEAIARLKRHESDLKKKLKAFLREQLDAVDRLDSVPSEPRRPLARPGSIREEAGSPPLRATPSAPHQGDDDQMRRFSWKENRG